MGQDHTHSRRAPHGSRASLTTPSRSENDPVNTSATTRIRGGRIDDAPDDVGRIAVVLGTRPEIIKLAGVIRELGDRARVIHTGQHYDDSMSGQFFRQLGLPAPDRVLAGIGGADRGTQIATAIGALTEEFQRSRPSAVIVQGDTNAVSAGAQAANYLGIPVVHVEAGLRSGDRGMPEELNRLVVGALADVHCAPTETSRANLLREGVPATRVEVTGNTVVEATLASIAAAADPAVAVEGVPVGEFVLATIHRPENTDTEPALRRVLEGLAALGLPVVLPLHPRTAAAVERHGLRSLLDGMTVLEPVGHASFIWLALRATLIVADSGGVQEECTVLKRPLVVVRRSTERPEAVDAGFAVLVRPGDGLATAALALLAEVRQRPLASVPSPYGDGGASRRIADLAVRVASGTEPIQRGEGAESSA
jgi:UDP-N-acetylglucosamine 2-epimerase (non-hydrolysing)